MHFYLLSPFPCIKTKEKLRHLLRKPALDNRKVDKVALRPHNPEKNKFNPECIYVNFMIKLSTEHFMFWSVVDSKLKQSIHS